jgi:hypothetical protein
MVIGGARQILEQHGIRPTSQRVQMAQILLTSPRHLTAEQIRAALRERAKTYMGRYGELDLGKWRRACLATAGRVAMLLSCDVEDAIAAVLRLRGFDDVGDDQRASVLLESPEALDLFRFALSSNYFKLREALGMALRRAK